MTQEIGLYQGSSSLTDTHHRKPFRSDGKIRTDLFISKIANTPTFLITPKPHKTLLNRLLKNPTITKISHCIGLDVFSQTTKPLSNIAYFFHPAMNYPLANIMTVWDNLPVKKSFIEQSTQQVSPSKEFQNENLFVPANYEISHKNIIQEVKNIIAKEIDARKIIPEESYPLSFLLGKDIGISGLSGDIVCFIADKNKKMHLAVKIFIGDDCQKNYDSEVLGYRIISDLNLKLVKVPTIFISEMRTGFAFICMNYINGKSLAELMNHSPEAIRLCARANLELHLAKRASNVEISQNQIAIFEKAIQMVIEKITAINADFLPADIICKLTNKWEELHKAFISNPGQLSFTHGDPNHSNWIVDLEHQHVNYIDLSQFDRSVSNQNSPHGFAINELEESLLTITIAARRLNLSIEKTQEIQNIYSTEYLSHAPLDITTKEARQYFAAYWRLRVIDNLLEKLISTNIAEKKSKHQLHLQEQIDLFLNQTIHN
jgi:tRNA A-37 threonylcarbamoyl transferase component Bud32